ncbi:MAG TPA: hypothetical protein PK825_00615 [Bacteroidales bacterium]|nr:hypothetical protein [Bacteroidales bacterium]
MNTIENPEFYKKHILPKFESKIKVEICKIVDEKLKTLKNFNNDDREQLIDIALKTFYNSINAATLEQFFENVYAEMGLRRIED